MISTKKPLRSYTPHVGTGGFLEYVERRYLLVDKTLFVKHFWECSYGVSLITRPRRWGKTFNLSILEAFFSIPVNSKGAIEQETIKKRRAIFSSFKMGQDPEFIKDHLGQYPVIFLTFKSLKVSTQKEALSQIRTLFSEAYEMHAYLLKSDSLSTAEKSRFRSYLNETALEEEWPKAIQFLMKLLHRYFGKRVILLIDEYDTPFNMLFAQKILREKAPVQASQKERAKWEAQEELLDWLLQFFQILLGTCLKGSELFLEKAVVTGILRIAKANLFSSVNNLGEFGILENDPNDPFIQDFGFLLEEVEGLLKQGGWRSDSQQSLESWLLNAQSWYNGYQIMEWTLYNPWSISSWIAKRGLLKPYWVQTASEELLKVGLLKGISEERVQQLLKHQEVSVSLLPALALEDLNDSNIREDLVWTLLLFAGYLSVRQEEDDTFWIRIPNREIQLQFERLVTQQVKGALGKELAALKPWILSLRSGDIETFCKGFQKDLAETASFYHTRKKAGNFLETFYHGLVMGILLVLKEFFFIESEREAGEGRLDLLLLGKPGTSAAGWGYLFEFKAARKSEPLEALVKSAVRQIRNQDYERRLSQEGRQAQVWRVAMAFSGKNVHYAYRLHGQTDAEEIRALAGEYYSEDREEMMQRLSEAIQEALRKKQGSTIRRLSELFERLENLLS